VASDEPGIVAGERRRRAESRTAEMVMGTSIPSHCGQSLLLYHHDFHELGRTRRTSSQGGVLGLTKETLVPRGKQDGDGLSGQRAASLLDVGVRSGGPRAASATFDGDRAGGVSPTG
jgi:hypothetical protein